MCTQPQSDLFLPVTWTGDERGIASLAWTDDPLHGQIVLREADYRRCFPQNTLPWPRLGQIILPDGVPDTVVSEATLTASAHILTLAVTVRNDGDAPACLETIRLALPMDQCFRENDVFKYEQNVLRHAGLIGHGAYLYWQKPGGRPPLYLMVAQGDTAVSHFHVDTRYAKDSMQAAFEGLYLLEMTDVPVRLDAGDALVYTFRLAIVETEARRNEALYRLGGLGADVLPGMAVQRGETLRLRLNTQRTIERVAFIDECAPVVDLGNGLYQSVGAGSGEKRMLVSYADGGHSVLAFFVIDPVRDILHHFARHVAANQFETDPEDPCYHAILPWNLTDRCRVNRRHNPFDSWMAGGSDEIGLVSGLFLAEMNCYWPKEAEIRVLALHVEDFIEERLTEQPGNRVHRMVPWFEMFEPWAGHGADDVWRAFNYVHVANICYSMYRIARKHAYPFLQSARHYLRRAYDYAVAMFAFWMFPEGEGATKYGNMGEMNLPLRIVPALREEGLQTEADHLDTLVREKAAYFSTRAYPFGSEMAFDTTAYEAVYAYAKRIGDMRTMGAAVAASLANRSRTPAWHKYSVDVRGGGDSTWNVSYMTQLGAWPVADMLLEGHLADPEAAMMAHAATLGGFCMYNSGGCWDDAPVNRHASNWVWNERLAQRNHGAAKPRRIMTGEVGLGYFGALYTLCTFRLNHPRLGSVTLGGTQTMAEGVETIYPDPAFGLRFCDLAHNIALVCEDCEIEQVCLQGKTIQATVHALPGRTGEMALRIRRDTPGQWKTLRAPCATRHVFTDQLP